jgi:hypothetical protein
MPDPQLKDQPKSLCEYFSQWEEFEETVWYDGDGEFDAAFVGFGWQGAAGPIVVYDQDKVLEIMVATREYDGEDPMIDALDDFGVNVQGTYAGEHTPIFLTYVEDGAVEDFLKRKAGAELSGWSRDIAAEGVTEIN